MVGQAGRAGELDFGTIFLPTTMINAEDQGGSCWLPQLVQHGIGGLLFPKKLPDLW